MTQQGIDAEVGARIHHEMWRARVTQKQLSTALGIDQAAVSRRLRGTTSWKVSELLEVAKLLRVSFVELVPVELAQGPEVDIAQSRGRSRQRRVSRRNRRPSALATLTLSHIHSLSASGA